MNRTGTGILLLASLLLLGACDLRLNEHVMKARENDSDMRKANRVDLVQFNHQINFDGGKSLPNGAEYDRFDTFANSIKLGYGDEVVLRGSTPARREAMRAYLERLAIPVTIQSESGSKDELSANAIKVVVNRYVVTPPACPNWSNFDGTQERNTPGSNYGCSVDASLGHMIANPRDLVQGQTMEPAYSNPMVRTLSNYEQGKAIRPKSQSSKGG